MDDGYVRQRQDGKEGGQDGAEEVYPEHHLLAGDFVGGKYLVLGGVGGAIECEVDEEVYDADERGVGLCVQTGSFLLWGVVGETHEDGDAAGDDGDDEIFVGGKFASVE
jgi:hypothetical protein